MKTKECPRCGQEIIADLALCPFCDFDWDDPEAPPKGRTGTPATPGDGAAAGDPLREGPLFGEFDDEPRTAYRSRLGGGRLSPRLALTLLAAALCCVLLALIVAGITPGRKERPPEGEVSADGGDAPPAAAEELDEAWESKARQWGRILREGGTVLRGEEGRGGPPPAGTVPAATRREEEQQVEVVALDPSIRPGDLVEILWISPDGSLWEKVLPRPVAARSVSRSRASIGVGPDEARKIAAARTRGEVYAVSP